MALHENIYRLRVARNMTQGDLAEALEVSRQSVSKWETGTAVPELDKLIKLSQIFGVSIDELVGCSTQKEETATEDTPPVSASSNNDIVSIGILILAVLLSLFAVLYDHRSIVFFIFCLYILPPLATWTASRCSTHNKIIYRIYMVFNILISVVSFISILGMPYIAIIPFLVNMGVISHWAAKKET